MEFEWPETVGDAYEIVDEFRFGSDRPVLAFASLGPAQRQVLSDDGTHIVRLEPDPGRWGWTLVVDDGDVHYVGHPDDGAPFSWVDLTGADQVRLLQRRRDVLPDGST